MATVPADLQLSDDQYEVWVNRLEMATKARIPHERVWKDLREYYKGNYFDNESDEDRVTAPWHFVAVRQMMSTLYFQDPSMNFTGLTAKGMNDALIGEEVARYERKVIDADKAERAALLNALKYGTGILKFAWNTQYGDAPAFADKQKEKGSLQGPSGSTVKDEALIVEQAPWTEHNLLARFGHANIRSIPPWNFLVDPDFQTYEEASWVAHRFHRRWIDAKNDKRWDDKAREMLEPTGHSDLYSEGLDSEYWQKNHAATDTALSTFYEIWDKTTQQIIVLSPHIPLALEVKPYPYQGADGPYQVIQFYPNDEDFWAIPYMDTFTPQVLADAKLKTDMFDHIQRWSPTRGAYAKGRGVDDEDMQRLASTKDGQFVGMNLSFNEKLADLLHILPSVPVSGDVYRAQDKFKSDYDQVSGISENARGGGSGVQTATEASIIDNQASLRTGDMSHEVDKMLRGSTRKMMGLLRQFWGASRVIPIVGEDGKWWDVQVTKAMLNGDYDVDIQPGSSAKVDRNARMRQNLELMGILAQFQPLVAQQGYVINFPEVLKGLLEASDIVKNPDRILVPITPQQMQAAQGLPGPPGQAPAEQPANVNGLDQIPTTTGAFQGGRGFSEAQGAGVG